MFQMEFQTMDDRGGGGGYGEVLAPVYNSSGRPERNAPEDHNPHNPNISPQYGYSVPPPSQGYSGHQSPPVQQYPYPQYGQGQAPSPPQYPTYPTYPTYSNPPNPPPSQPPYSPPQFDTLIPEVPREPAIQSRPRGLLNSGSKNGRPVATTPQTGEKCEYCQTGRTHNHSHVHGNSQVSCASAYHHIKNCPICTGGYSSNTRFLWGIIILLLLIIVVMWFRLQRTNYMKGGRTGSGGLLHRRQPYVQAGRLGRMFQS